MYWFVPLILKREYLLLFERTAQCQIQKSPNLEHIETHCSLSSTICGHRQASPPFHSISNKVQHHSPKHSIFPISTFSDACYSKNCSSCISHHRPGCTQRNLWVLCILSISPSRYRCRQYMGKDRPKEIANRIDPRICSSEEESLLLKSVR